MHLNATVYYQVYRNITYTVNDTEGRPVPGAFWDETWTSCIRPEGYDGYSNCNGVCIDNLFVQLSVPCDGSTNIWCQGTQTIMVSGWPASGYFWGPWTVTWTYEPAIHHSGCGD